jgi:hypothetical protein
MKVKAFAIRVLEVRPAEGTELDALFPGVDRRRHAACTHRYNNDPNHPEDTEARDKTGDIWIRIGHDLFGCGLWKVGDFRPSITMTRRPPIRDDVSTGVSPQGSTL